MRGGGSEESYGAPFLNLTWRVKLRFCVQEQSLRFLIEGRKGKKTGPRKGQGGKVWDFVGSADKVSWENSEPQQSTLLGWLGRGKGGFEEGVWAKGSRLVCFQSSQKREGVAKIREGFDPMSRYRGLERGRKNSRRRSLKKKKRRMKNKYVEDGGSAVEQL